jgi:serine/threonine protein kinase
MIEVPEENLEITKKEVQALMKLDHPCIVKYYESFQNEKYFCIVMEFCEGKTLRKYISKQTGPLKEKFILEFLFQMVNILKYVHSNHIVHRDIKPQWTNQTHQFWNINSFRE